MSQEITMWTILSSIKETGSVLESIEGLDNHPNVVFGLGGYEYGFKEVKNFFDIDSEEFDQVYNIIDKISAFHEKDQFIIGFKDENEIISIGLKGSFCIIEKNKESELDITTMSFDEGGGFLSRLLSKMHSDMIELVPKLKREKVIRDAQRAENLRRQNRIKNVPEMPSDFWKAIHELADYSENFMEFKLLMSCAMDDISDRNLTRLGRASEILLDESDLYLNSRCEVAVYRCLPKGCSIEEGDWVTTSYDYALMHASNVRGEYEVVEEYLPGDELICGADENEMYYAPREIWGDCESLEDVWKSVTYRKRMAYEPMERIVNRALKKEGLEPLDKSHTMNL